MPHDPDAFIAGLVDDLKPVAPLRQRRGMALAMLALVAGGCAMVGLFGMRADFQAGDPDAAALLAAGLFLVLALASAWAVVDMARPLVGVRREGWGWTALMAAVVPLSGLILIAASLWRGGPSGISFAGRSCLEYGLCWGLLTGAGLTGWLRAGAPSDPRRAGLLVGVAAGAAGIFAVSLSCPQNDLIHIGIWHGLTVVIAGLMGRLAVPRLIRW